MIYTAMLNGAAAFESDLTVTRLGRQEFFVVTGRRQTTRDVAWIDAASAVGATRPWST